MSESCQDFDDVQGGLIAIKLNSLERWAEVGEPKLSAATN